MGNGHRSFLATKVTTNRKTTLRFRRLRNEQFNARFVKQYVQGGGGSIGVWGCMANRGIGQCQLYSGRMNANFYKQVLENSLLPSVQTIIEKDEKWDYVQDNAPCHRANLINAWFREKELTAMDWPARSPDLNPIEHIWSIIDQKLTKHVITSMAELERLIKKYWDEIPKETCQHLVESMPKRISACISAHGGYFKY